MALRKKIKQILFTFGLDEREYKLIEDKIIEDNRVKLASASCIVSFFMLVMFIFSLFIEDLARTPGIYAMTTLLTISLMLFPALGKKYRWLVSPGVYVFITLALSFGIYQGIVAAPEEQTASFMVLMVAIPVWFGMKPLHMIACIYTFAGLFIACILKAKSGYVQTADIVNTLVYSTSSALISTYYTCIKSKRFYAEYLTDQMSKTDMLTGLGNRHAYTELAAKYEAGKFPDDLTIIYLDVNELKHVNDTFGHHAGDELICGAAECISKVFGGVGGCYRTGGDEFIVLGEVGGDALKELCAAFEREVENWKGTWGQTLRISYGSAAAREMQEGDLIQISKLADSRLYEAKAMYYSSKGIDRREQQKAYRSICESYIKILQVNLTTDTCKVIHNEPDDTFLQQDSSGCFSRWMQIFGSSGFVHPEDVEEFRTKTDVDYLREYFRSGKKNIHIFYRRKHGSDFRSIMTEMMASFDYAEDHQVVYFYVKNIDREGV